jgi:hypothetical protein
MRMSLNKMMASPQEHERSALYRRPKEVLWRKETDDLAFNKSRLRDLPEFARVKCVIFPDDRYLECWQILILALVMYTATVTTYRIAFIDDESDDWFAVDNVVNGLFILDVIINCFLAYYDSQMNLITDHKAILSHYSQTWLVVDLIGCMPVQYIGYSSNYSSLARLPRVFKLFRITKLIRIFKTFKERTSHSRHFMHFFQISIGVERLIWMMFMFLLLIHLVACLWAVIGNLGEEEKNWIFIGGYTDYGSWELYVVSLYWATATLSTVGYGDVVAENTTERLICALTMLLGIFVYSYVISSITSLLSNLDTRKTKLAKKIELITDLARKFCISKPFYKKLCKVIQYENSHSMSGELYDLINGLPSKVRSKLMYVINKTMIESNNFFEGKTLRFVGEVTAMLRPLSTEAGEILYREEEEALEMYLIYKGEVSFVVMPSLEAYMSVKQYRYFGETDLLVSKDGKYTVTALTSVPCELYTLSKDKLLALLDKHHEIKAEMVALALDRQHTIQELRKLAYADFNTTPLHTIREGSAEISRQCDACADESEGEGGDDQLIIEDDGSASRRQLSTSSSGSEVNFYHIIQQIEEPKPAPTTFQGLRQKITNLEKNVLEIKQSQGEILKRFSCFMEKVEGSWGSA